MWQSGQMNARIRTCTIENRPNFIVFSVSRRRCFWSSFYTFPRLSTNTVEGHEKGRAEHRVANLSIREAGVADYEKVSYLCARRSILYPRSDAAAFGGNNSTREMHERGAHRPNMRP